jgi:hypothetical protein
VYPNSANPSDSFGEPHQKAQAPQAANASYLRRLERDLTDANAAACLAALTLELRTSATLMPRFIRATATSGVFAAEVPDRPTQRVVPREPAPAER